MRVNALDHVNIITDDMARTTGFYADLLDLEVRDGPPPFKPEADVRPANGGPDWSFMPPKDIYVEAPGFGRDFRRDYGPVYLRLNPDALSEPAQPSACEPEEAPQ